MKYLQELVGSAKKRRQFLILGGLCALAVVVILAIVLSVVLIKRTNEDEETTTANPVVAQNPIALNDILRGALQPKRFNGTWIDDNSFHYFDMDVSF